MYKPCYCTSSTKNNVTTSLNNISSELHTIFDELPEDEDSIFHTINGHLYQRNLVILEGDVLFNIVRKQWKQIEGTVLGEVNIRNTYAADIRKQVIEVLSLCRYSIQECKRGSQRAFLQNKLLRYLKLLTDMITPWSSLDEQLLIKLTSSSVKDEQLPVCHYFHMYLDAQWLLLTLHYLCEVPLQVFDGLVRDLVALSFTIFKKNNQKGIVEVNAFVCTCVKRLWVLLQLFNEKLFKRGIMNKSFWEIFNEALKERDSTFSLWLLNQVAVLYGYTEDGEFVGPINSRVCENYTLMDSKLKLLNTLCTKITNDNNEKLLNCCKLIDTLLNQWWVQTVKSEPYQVLWEIFNKHVNLTFGTDKTKKSSAEIVELVNHISNNTNTDNSYEYFLCMLTRHLTKFPNQWPRIRGRIYSKLPPHKMNDMSEAGIFNITLLFLSLANIVDVTEMTEKLSSLLLNLTPERRQSPLIINIHTSIVILHALQGFSVKEPSIPLMQFIQEAANNREMFHLIRLFVDGFDSIMNASQNFSLNQHILIENWISKYLISCHYNDLCCFLNVLLCNIKRIQNAGASSEWEWALKKHVLPALKSVASSSSSAPAQVGELAALIDMNPSSDNILIFTADAISPRVTCLYISTLLEDVQENFVMPKNHETAVLHAWIRCCLLNCENTDKLTKNIIKIGALSSILDNRINITTNPLCHFIKALSKLNLSDSNLRELCEQCFGRLDCWIVPYITTPSSESVTVHIYTCVALLFFHCAPLLYHKNRSSCLLNRLINTFLLSTDILMGKSPHPHILGAVNRTWHLFMHGIFTLDCSNDAYLERTMRDMIVRYVPLLSVTDSPILKCLDNKRLAVFIFEKISVAFLSHSSRSSEDNTTKTLKIIHQALENSISGETTEMVLESTLTSIFEVIMFQARKNVASNIVKYVSLSDKYEQLRQYVRISFMMVTERHLAFNANNYFQFTTILAKVIPADMRTFLPIIKKQVSEVERMRGVGYDNTLRQYLDRLEMLLNQ